ncbi:MAG: slipin family protein [Acidobacteriota bacterium]
MSPIYFVFAVFFLVFFLTWVTRSFVVLREYERAVTFWLGKLGDLKDPGLQFVFWPFVSFEKISLRTIVLDVPPQDVITRDNVSVKVNAVVYYRVIDPVKAVVEIENFEVATSQLAQTTLRSVLGQADLDELLSKREKLNEQLQEIVDSLTDPWGIKVAAVEVKHVDLPQEMQRAMAKQAEAEREKRAKVIHAEGELQASKTLALAANEVSQNPVTIQLRYLQTLSDIATERNSTIVFPLPIGLLNAISRRLDLGTLVDVEEAAAAAETSPGTEEEISA